MVEEQKFICTRPYLAALLLEAGEEVRPTVNVWHPEKSAWAITLTQHAAQMIQAFYIGRDLPVPMFVSQYLGSSDR